MMYSINFPLLLVVLSHQRFYSDNIGNLCLYKWTILFTIIYIPNILPLSAGLFHQLYYN
jgi:hypothetical protein